MQKIFISVLFLLCKLSLNAQALEFTKIKAQKVSFNTLFGVNSDNSVSVKSYQISNQITYGQYKEYLNAILKDSTREFYLSQLPSFKHQEVLKEKYLNTNEFDNFPVIGVSFDNALNYGIWYGKNLGNPKKTYRLPAMHEWVLWNKNAQQKNNYKESYIFDWTMNSYDKWINNSQEKNAYIFFYFYEHTKNSPPVFKLKSVAGSSFKMRFKSLIEISTRYGFYADQGYPDVGFRLVEVSQKDYLNKYISKDEIIYDIQLK